MVGLDGGEVNVRVGALFDPKGFERYTRAIRLAENHGKVNTNLNADVDTHGFNQYESEYERAQRMAHDDITAHGGMDFDRSGFQRYQNEADETERSSGRLRAGFGRVGGASAALVTSVGAAGLGLFGLGASLSSAFSAYKESEEVANQTNAVIKSTGGAAKVTATEVADLAGAISAKTGVDDEAIQSGQNLLLTFTGIRNEAGKGNDVFNQATHTLVDMSTALGTDAKASAVQLGKALNDPIKGVTALQKVGVTFTAQQKDQIKTLVDSGKKVQAQKIILGELNKEFGGSAEATATWSKRLKVTLGNAVETIGGKLSPVIEEGAKYLNDFVTSLMDGSAGSSKFGRALAPVIKVVRDIWNWSRQATSGIIGFFRSVKSENSGTLTKIFKNVGDTLAAIVKGARAVGRGIKDAFSGKAGGNTTKDLKQIASVILSFIGTVTDLYKAVAVRAIPGIVKAFKGLAQIIRGVIQVISGILTGDFGKAWQGVKNIFNGGIKAIMGITRAATAPFREIASRVFGVFKTAASSAWGFVTGIFNKGLDKIFGAVSSVLGLIASVAEKASKLPFIGGKFKGLADDIRGTQKSIDKYRESLRDTDKTQDRAGTSVVDLSKQVKTYRDRLKTLRSGTAEHRDTVEKLRKKQGELSTAFDKTQGPAKKAEKGIRGVSRGASGAGNVVRDAAKSIGDSVGGIAKGLQVKAPSFSIGKLIKDAASTIGGLFATGGIPNPGSGAADDHVLFDPSGRPVAALSGTEGIINTPQMGEIHNALQVAHAVGASRYNGLDDLWSSGMRHYAGGGAMGRADSLDRMHLPYVWGGHHGEAGPIKDPRPGLDCSSSVSYVLNIPPRVSGDFMNFGSPGKGPITLYANPEHIFMSIAGRGFGTSHENPGGGPGWLSYNSRSGFAVRHVDEGFVTGGDTSSVQAPPIIGPKGPLLSVANAASKRMAKDGNTWLTKQYASMDSASGQPLAEGAYTKPALMALWQKHKGPGGATANVAGAIALAESGGDPNQRNSIGATGLWQIYNGAGTSMSLKDPDLNAGAAVGKYRGAGNSFRPWTTYTGADTGPGGGPGPKTYLKFLKNGGRLGKFNGGGVLGGGLNLPKFGGGGKTTRKNAPAKKKPTQSAAVSAAYKSVRSIRRMQTDRIGDFEGLQVDVDHLNKDYGIADRRYSLTDEELINDAGEVDAGAVKRRAAELQGLLTIRRKIYNRVAEMKKLAARVVKSYKTMIKRLQASLKHAKKKERGGVKSSIATYTERLGEWRGKLSDIGYDLQDAGLDKKSLQLERASVLGTKAEPKDPEIVDPPVEDGTDPETPGDNTGETPTDAEPATLPPTAEDIAKAAAEQLSSFNAGRADLFGQFGSNFVTAGARGAVDDTVAAAGARYFGATTSGDEGDRAGAVRDRSGLTQIFHVATLPEPMTWAADVKYQTDSLVGG